MKYRKCVNCESNNGLGVFVGNIPVNLCFDCDIKIHNQCLGKTDKQIRNMFWSYS